MHPSLNLADEPEGTSARTRISQQLLKEVYLCEIDDFVAATA
jgi:hypothetical protein